MVVFLCRDVWELLVLIPKITITVDLYSRGRMVQRKKKNGPKSSTRKASLNTGVVLSHIYSDAQFRINGSINQKEVCVSMYLSSVVVQ